jgi:hypothetical protein
MAAGLVFTSLSNKRITMKQNNLNPNSNNPAANPGVKNTKGRPDVRDNLDSRKNEEQNFKGDDVTHNAKETKENNLKKK